MLRSGYQCVARPSKLEDHKRNVLIYKKQYNNNKYFSIARMQHLNTCPKGKKFKHVFISSYTWSQMLTYGNMIRQNFAVQSHNPFWWKSPTQFEIKKQSFETARDNELSLKISFIDHIPFRRPSYVLPAAALIGQTINWPGIALYGLSVTKYLLKNNTWLSNICLNENTR